MTNTAWCVRDESLESWGWADGKVGLPSWLEGLYEGGWGWLGLYATTSRDREGGNLKCFIF